MRLILTAVITVALAAIPSMLPRAGAARATAGLETPDTIELTFVPSWADSDSVQGRVHGVDPATHKVALYIFLQTAGGWWTKPTFISPLTEIKGDSTWIASIVTGGIDPYATRVIAFLVPDGFNPPLCGGCPDLPAALFQHPYAIVCRAPGQRHIDFSEYRWTVKKADTTTGPVGPGTNFFSDDPEDVRVDTDGLHLTITEKIDGWFSTEVIIDTSLGYGTYIFEIVGRVDSLDQNIVLGLFTWDDCSPFDNNNPNEFFREIDIEFSLWGIVNNNNAQFVVQPDIDENIFRFDTDLSDDPVSTHLFAWGPDGIQFQSTYGESITTWLYTGDDIPIPGRENVRINFWIIWGADAPADGREAEMVIRRFAFRPQTAAGIDDDRGPAPALFSLGQNFPNPFNPETTIHYELYTEGYVELALYNALGQRIRTLVSNTRAAGVHTARWDGKNDAGGEVATGVYWYRLSMGDAAQTKKMLLIR